MAIEQKTTNKNPRSTVGTVTEISDFLRLLYARASRAYSPVTGEEMVHYTDEQIVELILKEFGGRKIAVTAPIVKGRKGQYRELFDAVMSLDRRYRLPVLLYYYEGYRQREIAGLLGIPEETVRTRLARAREKLKHILSEVPQYA